ncbi:hypothetical protein CsatA_026929 [Cannabis sativa]
MHKSKNKNDKINQKIENLMSPLGPSLPRKALTAGSLHCKIREQPLEFQNELTKEQKPRASLGE